MLLKDSLMCLAGERRGHGSRRLTSAVRGQNHALGHVQRLQPRQLLSATNPLPLSSFDGTNGFRLDGFDTSDQSGSSVSSPVDVNRDDFDDLIIGASFRNRRGSCSVESYVVFGGNFTGGAETQVGTDDADTLTANKGTTTLDILIGGRGNDILISDGGPDVLRGGAGGNGTDTLRLDGS